MSSAPTCTSDSDDVLVGLAFSGGGTRAAAFAHGVLPEIDQTTVPTRTGTHSLLDRVGFVSGVSGGAVTAAYYGLKKRAALADFREKFLIRNAEEELNTSVDPAQPREGASPAASTTPPSSRAGSTTTCSRARPSRHSPQDRRPRVWINASDIYNRTPFIYGETAFIALCSDLATYPIADAVAASAAVPIVFTPMVIKTYPKRLHRQAAGLAREGAHQSQRAADAQGVRRCAVRYHDGSTKYVKLLDGGLVDNFGLSGFTISRLSAETPHEPLSPEQAVRLRRSIVILVDAGRAPSGDWVQTVEGPSGIELVMAAADTAVQASVRASYTAFERIMADWQRQLDPLALRPLGRRSASARRGAGLELPRHQVSASSRVGFDQLGPERAKVLNAVDTLQAAGRAGRCGDRRGPRCAAASIRRSATSSEHGVRMRTKRRGRSPASVSPGGGRASRGGCGSPRRMASR